MFARLRFSAAWVALLASAAAVTPGQSQTPADLNKIKQAISNAMHNTPATPAGRPVAPAPAAQATAPAQTLSAKIDEALMGPRTQRITLSDDGDHIGIIAPKGSREVVLLDGVEGPVFEEIPRNSVFGTPEVQWSPTGGHSGYIGRRGGDYIAVVDGKEAVTLQTAQSAQGMGYTDLRGWRFWFSKDGAHIAYTARPTTTGWVMVLDGVKSPEYRAIDLNQTVLNGNRLIYVAQTADQKWHLVADGKPGLAYDMISSLLVTPDGAHYAHLANLSGVGAQQAMAVVDGVASPRYYGVADLELAPDGRAAYVAVTTQGNPGGHGGASGELMVGGLRVANTLTWNGAKPGGYSAAGYKSQRVAWSPDGKRFAYVQQNTPNPGVTVMVNGKPMGLSYSTASDLTFSPDGGHFFYVAVSPTGQFPVIDGQELNGYHWIKEFQWSPDGKRYAFYGANSTGIWMVVDGKEQPKSLGIGADALLFSPDSKHLAFSAQATVANYQPVVDGVIKPFNLQNFFTRNNPPLRFPIFSFSPDGNHLAFVAFTLDPMPKGGVVVDGTVHSGTTASFTYPSWSPDSKHFAAVNTTGKGWVVMIDGKLSASYEDLLSPNVAAARFVDAHTYRWWTIRAGQVYRVRFDLQ